ncbi:hypothetical protein EXIGLDRAFT_741512 [Exidia glandulosa HHB12029]|uniref:RRM domain-containing protein n=1 Tax=Exidia glandulosa HHB12029 TaxID=1314781 RepID=A0A165EFU1_EXIGL|nr:hypothetical protein EXIGLDRAFT_741512 [Exidia glandulosa HHB12029]
MASTNSSQKPGASSSRPSASPMPPTSGPNKNAVNTQTVVIDNNQGRILAIADIRGKLSQLNDLAAEAGAKAILHTGDFGFFEQASLQRISDRTLRHMIMYSPLIQQDKRNQLLDQQPPQMRQSLAASPTPLLSEFPLLLNGQLKLNVPVFTVWGACEDVAVLEKFRSGAYHVDNLHVLDEATTRVLDIGGIKLRLLGLGGAFVPHRMFDNGDGQATVAGGQGTMWTTALQIGELVDTSQKVFDASETRLLLTHASPGREGLLAQLALVVKADLTVSAGLHFRYSSSWNEFSVQNDLDGYRQKLISGKDSFERIWENVKTQVDAVIDEPQRVLLEKAIMVAERILPAAANSAAGGATATEDPAWKNCWNWNLCDAAYGSLVLDIKEGRVSGELKSQGFNFAYRRTAATQAAGAPAPAASGLPAAAPAPPANTAPAAAAAAIPAPTGPSKAATPAPSDGKQSASTPAKPSTPAPAPGSAEKTNGATDPKAAKKEKRKEKEREKREKEKEEKAAAAAAAKDEKPTVNTSVADGAKSPDADALLSPSEGGARTPTSRKGPRNPWTLFMKVPPTTTEAEVRDFFNDAKDGITKVAMPPAPPNRPTRIVYVEFGDEEAMKAGQTKHAEKIKDMEPRVVVAEDRSDGPGSQGTLRGRGRGRGGGFAHRGLAAAGLAPKARHDD